MSYRCTVLLVDSKRKKRDTGADASELGDTKAIHRILCVHCILNTVQMTVNSD
jgi:hypothetical protein